MAGAETARLIAELSLKDKLSPGVKTATASLGKLDTGLGKLGQTARRGVGVAGKALAGLGVVAAGAIAVNVKAGIESLATLESAVTSVDGAIKQMGQTGQVTGAQIAGWANDIEANIGAAFDDKDITAATTTLIRFGRLSAANLRPAMQVMTDLATKTGSVESAASLLAKALADPAKAAGKLSRAGVVLTKAEQKQIAAFIKAGKVGKAQEVILNSLAKTTAGAAAASQGPYQRAMSTLADVTEDAQRALAEGFLPVLQRAADWLRTKLADPATLTKIRDFGQGLAGAFDKAVTFAQRIPWSAIGSGLEKAADFAGKLFDAFRSMPPEVQATLIALAGLNKLSGGAISGIVGELGKGLIKGVLGITAAVVNVNGATVNGGGALTGAAGTAAGVAGGITAAGVASASAVIAGIAAPIALSIALNELAKRNTPVQPIKTTSGNVIPGTGVGGVDWFQGLIPSFKRLATEAGATAVKVGKLGSAYGSGPGGAPQGPDDGTVARAKPATITNPITASFESKMAALQASEESHLIDAKAAVNAVESTARVGLGAAARATYSGAQTVAGAVRASRPIITTNVNVYVTAASVTKSTTTQSRYGTSNGSAYGSGPGGAPAIP
jgi:hypothetical protein